MDVLFMGSPEFAIPSLDALSEEHDFEIVTVVTQPDRPAGRGRKLKASPVKQRCIDLGLRVFQPYSLKSPETVSSIHALNPDLIVVAAYGMILPQSILDLPKFNSINVHASLLPRWRGASPIQAAIQAGDSETGVTIMKMDPGLDTGPILSQSALVIHSSDTGGMLSDRLARLGADLLIESLPRYLSGELQPTDQDDKKATYAPMLTKSDGRLDFMRSALDLERQVRAYEPWPVSFFDWGTKRVIIRKADSVNEGTLPPGTVGLINDNIAIGANPGALILRTVQPAGKNEMAAEDFLRGARGILHSSLQTSQV